jgi:hypothetical protein
LDRGSFNSIVRDCAVKRREKYKKFLMSVEILQDMEEY